MRNVSLFVALDSLVSNEAGTLAVARTLAEASPEIGFKVNLDYLLQQGLENGIGKVASLGRPVFADVKAWNSAHIMQTVIENLVAFGVAYLTVHALADTELTKAVKATHGTSTKVLGVTVLTHYDDKYCKRHFGLSLCNAVRRLASIALDAGCHGIVLPGTALCVVRDLKTIKVVPGIRPSWYKDTRHREEVEPRIAMESGADTLVCGDPIMKSTDPVSALHYILSEMQQVPVDSSYYLG